MVQKLSSKQTHRQMNRQTHRQMDRQTHRQTDSTEIITYPHTRMVKIFYRSLAFLENIVKQLCAIRGNLVVKCR